MVVQRHRHNIPAEDKRISIKCHPHNIRAINFAYIKHGCTGGVMLILKNTIWK